MSCLIGKRAAVAFYLDSAPDEDRNLWVGNDRIVSPALRSDGRGTRPFLTKRKSRDAPSLYSFSVIHSEKGRHLGRSASHINRTIRPRTATQRDRKGRGVPLAFLCGGRKADGPMVSTGKLVWRVWRLWMQIHKFFKHKCIRKSMCLPYTPSTPPLFLCRSYALA